MEAVLRVAGRALRPEHPLPEATIVFDRFHLSQHLSRAVDEVRRQSWRQMAGREKAEFKRTRFLWLTNPANLRREERTRLSTLLRLNSPIVRRIS
jgi:transposase